MPTRRTALIVIGAIALRITSPKPIGDAWAQAGDQAGDQAVRFVKSTSERLTAIVNSNDSPQEKRERIKNVIDATVDVDDLGRFCLGRFWRLAALDQQKQYMALFHDLLVMKVAAHLGEYKGVKVDVGLARRSADTEIVITRIEGRTTATPRVDWVVSTTSGTPKIVDLLAGDTSLRLTQSADFIAYLAHHNYSVQDLIEGMRQMLARTPNVSR